MSYSSGDMVKVLSSAGVSADELTLAGGMEQLVIKSEDFKSAVSALKDAGYLHLINYTAMETEEALVVLLLLRSASGGGRVWIRTQLSKEEPVIDSISELLAGAAWFEREIYDMFGIKFNGHPDLRRILLPDDWKGHPLRKDYEEDSEYNGMPTQRAELLEDTK